MLKVIFSSVVIVCFVLVACKTRETVIDEETLFLTHCGGCHALPDPASLPKAAWEEGVLPEMAARLGVRFGGYDPFANLSMEDAHYVHESGVYPQSPSIDSSAWWRLHDYILRRAPDKFPVDATIRQQRDTLTLFRAQGLPSFAGKRTSTTALSFSTTDKTFIVGNTRGEVHRWPFKEGADSVGLTSPVVAYCKTETGQYITEVGILNPSEVAEGRLHLRSHERTGIIDEIIADRLHRPVHTTIVDLNADGTEEAVVSEFGNYTGELSLHRRIPRGWEKQTIIPLPGVVRTMIIDFDGDEKLDLISLLAQGREGIYVSYQMNDLNFRTEQILSSPAVYGSSWFDYVDMDEDGDKDFVVASGDNADYSNVLKPYHGFRIYNNDGANNFQEIYHYPAYGATRFEIADFDQDGSKDIALMAYFPDFSDSNPVGFILLLQRDGNDTYNFDDQVTPATANGRWLVMAQGDHDEDGDTDLMLGAFFLPPPQDSLGHAQRWAKEGTDLLLLENTLRD